MVYEFECEKCERRVEQDFRMGEAPKEVPCPSCGGGARRVFSAPAIGIDGAINRTSTFGEDMKRRNLKAAKRMKGRKPPVRTVAHDYGNGRVEEVK